jgi:7-alpha-hydroxysteroid dehydrogenase
LSFTLDAFDRIDILVNASRQIMTTDPLDPDDDSVLQSVAAEHADRPDAQQGHGQADDQAGRRQTEEGSIGSIINLSSIAATGAHPSLLAYSISSAASDQMTRALAVALAPKRIRVNAVAFGSVMSASLKGALKEQEGLRKEICRTPRSAGSRARAKCRTRCNTSPRMPRGSSPGRSSRWTGAEPCSTPRPWMRTRATTRPDHSGWMAMHCCTAGSAARCNWA